MPLKEQEQNCYPLKKGIDERAFQNVRIDDISLKILTKASMIIKNKKHALNRKTIRFILLFYYDDGDPNNVCFHARFGIGLSSKTEDDTLNAYREIFPNTRVFRALEKSTGIVHENLHLELLKENKHTNSLPKNKKIVLGASFKLFASRKVIALNRSAFNGSAFNANIFAQLALPFDDKINFIKNRLIITIGAKLVVGNLIDIQNKNKIFILVKENGKGFELYFDKFTKISVPKNENLYLLLEKAYTEFQSNEHYNDLPIDLNGLLSFIHDANGKKIYNSVARFAKENGYKGSKVYKPTSNYALRYLRGNRNLPTRFFKKLMDDLFKIINEQVNQQGYSYKFDDLYQLDNIWNLKIQLSKECAKFLMMKTFIEIPTHDITNNVEISIPNRAAKIQKDFMETLRILKALEINIYREHCPKNIISLLRLMMERKKITFKIKDKTVRVNGVKSIIPTASHHIHIPRNLFKNSLEAFKEKEFISAENAPLEFFKLIIEHCKVQDNDNLDILPIWLMSYIKGLQNNTCYLTSILEQQLILDMNGKHLHDIIHLFTIGVQYAKNTNDLQLFEILIAVIDFIVPKKDNLGQTLEALKAIKKETMPNGTVDFLISENQHSKIYFSTPCGYNFYNTFLIFSDYDKNKIVEKMSNTLPTFICTLDAFTSTYKILSIKNQTILFDEMSDFLPKFIHTLDGFSTIYKILSTKNKNTLFDKIENSCFPLRNMVKNREDLATLCQTILSGSHTQKFVCSEKNLLHLLSLTLRPSPHTEFNKQAETKPLNLKNLRQSDFWSATKDKKMQVQQAAICQDSFSL